MEMAGSGRLDLDSGPVGSIPTISISLRVTFDCDVIQLQIGSLHKLYFILTHIVLFLSETLYPPSIAAQHDSNLG